jgi:hypothetical protein
LASKKERFFFWECQKQVVIEYDVFLKEVLLLFFVVAFWCRFFLYYCVRGRGGGQTLNDEDLFCLCFFCLGFLLLGRKGIFLGGGRLFSVFFFQGVCVCVCEGGSFLGVKPFFFILLFFFFFVGDGGWLHRVGFWPS